MILVFSVLVEDGTFGERRRREALVPSYSHDKHQEALEGRRERDRLERGFVAGTFSVGLVSCFMG